MLKCCQRYKHVGIYSICIGSDGYTGSFSSIPHNWATCFICSGKFWNSIDRLLDSANRIHSISKASPALLLLSTPDKSILSDWLFANSDWLARHTRGTVWKSRSPLMRNFPSASTSTCCAPLLALLFFR